MSKLSPAELEQYVFSRTGDANENLLVGPREAEDAAAIETGAGTLVVSTDPVSLAVERIGRIGVAVASNDVAASGGVPEYVVSTILLPELDEDVLDTITRQLHATCERLGLTIVGGHTESVAGLERPLLSLTCLGYTDRFVSTTTATPGDRVLLTKGAGIEATAVLASDFQERIDTDEDTFERALSFFDELSVMAEAAVCTPVATAMHDPTEGGVLGGLVEIARASDVDLVLDGDAVPVRPTTREFCAAMDVDPLRVLGSGALLATVPADEAAGTLDALEEEGIAATDIGHVGMVSGNAPAVVRDGQRRTEMVQDGMYALWG
ncbi:AIR synthase family protein [Halococcus qingdaonensis]|uniref:AIR synthase family protein n=1 Tax=Halococcus qingdaonensis TaxID=224402 RepID=UPI002116EFA1|nr:AIR synthase family protein [Halococcus qingdaonensis]